MNILKITLHNIGSYHHQEYELGAEPRLIVIHGINNESGSLRESNGSGKSMFFVDGPEWVLFGRIRGEWSKDILNDEILRIIEGDKRVDEGWGEVIFEVEDRKYTIERRIKNSSQSLKFWEITDADAVVNLSRSAKVDRFTGKKMSSIQNTQNAINEVLGCDAELAYNSVWFEQDNLAAFAKSDTKERENLLGVAIDKPKWLRYGEKCKDRRDKADTEMKKLEYYIDQIGDEKALNLNNITLKEVISSTKDTIIESKKKLKKLEKSLDSIKEKLAVLKENRELTISLSNKIGSLYDVKTNLEDSIKEYKNDISSYTNVIEAEHDKIEDLQSKILITATELLNLEDQYEEVDIDIIESFRLSSNESLININNLRNRSNNLIIAKENLRIVYCPGTKIKCVNVDNVVIEEKTRKIKQRLFAVQRAIYKEKKNNQDLINQSEELMMIARNNDRLDEVSLEYGNDHNMLEREILSQDSNIKIMKVKVESAAENLENLERKTTETIDELSILEKQLDEHNKSVESYDEIEFEHDTLMKNRDSLNKIIEDQTVVLISNESDLKVNLKSIEKLKESKEKVVELDSDVKLLDFAYKMYSKNIPHLLLENAVPEIEEYAKEFIERLSNGRIDVDFLTEKVLRSKDANKKQKTRNDFDIMITVDGKRCSYPLVSGGEKSRADVAVHLAYAMYLLNRSGAKLSTLFLDEVCGALDQEGKEILVEMLKDLMLNGYFKKILVITQDENLKRMIDDSIIVIKTSEGSSIAV